MENEQNIDPIYRHVGQRIKERRKALNISQGRLGELMDVSYQLVQKYESGLTQISLGRLIQFSAILNVMPEYFTEGLQLGAAIGERVESDIIQSRTRPFYILLIDDRAADALLVDRALSSYESFVHLHAINDAEQVGDFMNHHAAKHGVPHVDLILLDINMPKIGGLQLLKQLKSNRHTVGKPVVMLTNSISKREMGEAYMLGCAGFVQKSIGFEQFRQTIGTIVEYWAQTVILPD